MENKGLLVVISGFSGVGKGTVIQMVLDELPTLRFRYPARPALRVPARKTA